MRAAPTTAAGWFEQGLRDLALSRGADTRSEYQGDLRDAVAAFDRALALEPAHVDAHLQRGLALAALDEHEAALDSFVIASRLAPGDPALQLAVAQSFSKLGASEPALAAFERVLAVQPDHAEAEYGRAAELTRLHRDALALAAWDRVLARGDEKTLVTGGQTVRVLTGDFRRAQALLSRATCTARLGRPEARVLFFDAFDADALSAELLAATLAQHDEARVAYAAWLTGRPKDPARWHRAAKVYLGAGLSSEALDAYEVVLTLTPEDAHAWFGKGGALEQQGSFDAARAAYQRALELFPDFLGAQARLRAVDAALSHTKR